MPLGLLGLLDLSIVTDRLVKLLETYRQSTLFQGFAAFTVSGNPPDKVSKEGGSQLSIYLFHIESDKFQKNSPVSGARDSKIPSQPLSLNLYYLLSAFSDNANGGYLEEQQAMSIALRCFHENPIIRTNVILDGQTVKEEFCLTMEMETADSLGRLWQASTTAMRLATVYKVSVVFITPPAPAISPAPVWVFRITPEVLPFTLPGQLLSTSANLSYLAPDGKTYNISPSPALVAAGQRFFLYGTGLTGVQASHLYLLSADGTETDVTSWIQAREATRLELQIPSVSPPAPGVYQLRVGNDLAIANPSASRSNPTPFSIAAFVDPSGGAVVNGVIGSAIALSGQGFVPGKTDLLLGSIKLTRVSSIPEAGDFQVVNATTLQLQLPTTIASGRYLVRVRVNQVESLPAKWVEVA
ncbi:MULTISPECIES: Pvc16 family protein [unclassified Microcoleus]|uniref:Pvc16 family protein n=1 Tax=unclassified Microcoleus TaxID=2642155 RepID=UPI002FD3EE6B